MQRARMMDVDNHPKNWGLFENRPAKERTSAPTAGQPRQSSAHVDERWSRRPRRRRARTEAEHVKC
jgi:hypothetical protein